MVKKAAIITAIASGTIAVAALATRVLVLRAYERELKARGVWRYNDDGKL